MFENTPKQLKETIQQLEADMRHAAKDMKFGASGGDKGSVEISERAGIEYR
jgi:hypothetical protein